MTVPIIPDQSIPGNSSNSALFIDAGEQFIGQGSEVRLGIVNQRISIEIVDPCGTREIVSFVCEAVSSVTDGVKPSHR